MSWEHLFVLLFLPPSTDYPQICRAVILPKSKAIKFISRIIFSFSLFRWFSLFCDSWVCNRLWPQWGVLMEYFHLWLETKLSCLTIQMFPPSPPSPQNAQNLFCLFSYFEVKRLPGLRDGPGGTWFCHGDNTPLAATAHKCISVKYKKIQHFMLLLYRKNWMWDLNALRQVF